MTEAWRIDSIDASAGLAFASWRISDLKLDSLDLDRSAVFLSPPLFQPEAITNRSMGFGAARGQAQLGVYSGEAELAFETLDDLTEFVRRAYVSSGAGDAGGGGGGRGPPPLPDDPLPEVPLGGRGIAEGDVFEHPIVIAAKNAKSALGELDFEAGAPVQVFRFSVGAGERERIVRQTSALVDGATEIMLELLRRFPTNGDDRAIETWSRSAQSLGGAISRLNIWGEIVDGPYSADLERIVHTILPEADEGPREWSRYFIPNFFGEGLVGWPGSFDQMRFIDYVYGRSRFRTVVVSARNEEDPIDQLARWPLPAEVKSLSISDQDYPSAFSLMCAIVANPTILAESYPLIAVRAWSILLFAAAHLTAEGRPPSRSTWLISEARSGWRQALLEEATEWLFQQWPRMIFPEPVEVAIRQAAKLAP